MYQGFEIVNLYGGLFLKSSQSFFYVSQATPKNVAHIKWQKSDSEIIVLLLFPRLNLNP